MRVFRSLRVRLSVAAAVLALVVVALAGATVALQMNLRDRSDLDQQLQARLSRVDTDTEKMLGTGDTAKPGGDDDEYGDLLAGSDSLVRLLDGVTVVAQRGENLAAAIPTPDGDGFSTVTIGGQPWRSLVTTSTTEPGIRLQVLQSLVPIDARLDANVWLVVWVSLSATVLAALAGWWVGRAVLRPLDQLRAAAHTIRTDRDTPERLPAVKGPSEVADLSATLNDMLERLHSSALAARRFTADAGHELRNPLSSLGSYLETLERNPALPEARRQLLLDDALAEHRRLVSLLDGLQRLARGDARALPPSEPFSVQELVDRCVARARTRSPEVGFLTGAVTEVSVSGWREGLELAVDNLLDNAVRHGRPQGIVTVGAETDGSDVVISVGDDGPGIPGELREAVRGRFVRGPQPRVQGSGLGLALVDQQARLHGGRLELDDSAAGGLSAAIRLPRAR